MIENKFNNISLIVIVSFIESIGAYVYSLFLVAEVEVLLVAEVEELWSHYILCFHYQHTQLGEMTKGEVCNPLATRKRL
jgi:hypothetical protein